MADSMIPFPEVLVMAVPIHIPIAHCASPACRLIMVATKSVNRFFIGPYFYLLEDGPLIPISTNKGLTDAYDKHKNLSQLL